jgi:hypothetical protein
MIDAPCLGEVHVMQVEIEDVPVPALVAAHTAMPHRIVALALSHEGFN